MIDQYANSNPKIDETRVYFEVDAGKIEGVILFEFIVHSIRIGSWDTVVDCALNYKQKTHDEQVFVYTKSLIEKMQEKIELLESQLKTIEKKQRRL